MGLIETIQARDAVDKICAAIDAGLITPTEEEMMELALLVNEHGGLLKHDLLCKLASRSIIGREVLRKIAS